MDYTEEYINGEYKYKGKIVNVKMDNVRLVNGKTSFREVVEHPGGVCVLPVDEDLNCYMVTQFRYAFGKMLLEVPAGKLEYGEDPRSAGIRELSEETGFVSENIVDFGHTYSSPGIFNEIIYMYVATGLKAGDAHPDDNEFLNVVKYKLSDLVQMCLNGEIEDSKTNVIILKAARYFGI